MGIVELLIPTGVSTLAATAVVYFGKTIIQERVKNAIRHEYDCKLEAHKAQIKAEGDSILERLKAELQIAAIERNVRFSRVFEKTLTVIAETYAKLVVFLDAVDRLTQPPIAQPHTPSLEERRKLVRDSYEDFKAYYPPRRLFLPRKTAEQIDTFAQRLVNASNLMRSVKQSEDRPESDSKYWAEAWLIVQDNIPELLAKLETDFRTLLDLHDPPD
jgi:hypothetical protein